MYDVKKPNFTKNFISLFELGYGPLEFNFRWVLPTFDKVSG